MNLFTLCVIIQHLKVRLQKEQENRVKLELQLTELEDQVERHSVDLSSAMETQEQLKTDLTLERESKQVRGIVVIELVLNSTCICTTHDYI